MKKVFSLTLVMLMLISAIPTTFATTDYTHGTQVEYDANDKDGDGIIDNLNYTITVPAKLSPAQEGIVTLHGMWPSNATVKVTSEDSVDLVNSINNRDVKNLTVTFLGIEKAGDNTERKTYTEPVSVEGISDALFGTWEGVFYYNVEYKTAGLPEKGKAAEEYTWEELSAIAKANKANEYFALGDTKTFTTTEGQEVVMEMIAFNADEKPDGSKAGITWISKDLVAYRAMNPNYGTENYGERPYGWGGSELREWMQGEFFATLPVGLQNAISPVNKVYSDPTFYEAIWVVDSVWIPSLYELMGESYCNDKFGPTYAERFPTAQSFIKTFEGVPYFWWSRSANVSGSTGNVAYFGWGSSGYQTYSSSYNGSTSNGVVLCFCI